MSWVCVILPRTILLKKIDCSTSSSSSARVGLHAHIYSPCGACFLFCRLPLHSSVVLFCWAEAFLVSWGPTFNCLNGHVPGSCSKVLSCTHGWSIFPTLSSTRFRVPGLMLRSLTSLELSFFAAWEIKTWFHSSTWSYPVWPQPFLKDSVFSTMYAIDFFVKSQVALGVWPSMWLLNYNPLINEFLCQ